MEENRTRHAKKLTGKTMTEIIEFFRKFFSHANKSETQQSLLPPAHAQSAMANKAPQKEITAAEQGPPQHQDLPVLFPLKLQPP